MKKWVKVLFSVAFSFMFLFITIGYAQLADTLVINGTASFSPQPNGVIVTSVELMAGGTATDVYHGYMWNTNVISKIRGKAGQSLTYKVTVHNYSTYKYAYVGEECSKELVSEYPGNNTYKTANGISVTVKTQASDTTNTFLPGAAIEANKDLTFYVTYTVGNSVRNVTEFSTLIGYNFGIHKDDVGEYAVNGAMEKFAEILNNETTYNRLMSRLNSNINSILRGDYIGNVATSLIAGIFAGDDDDLIVDLFEGALIVDETEVKTLIQRNSIDSRPGEEMVIYLTPTDILGMNISNSKTYIPDVYCAVFTNSSYDSRGNPTGEWFQIGDLYTGKAYGQRYTTGISPSSWFKADSIKSSTWISTANTYKVGESYSYNVAAGKNITDIINAANSSVTSSKSAKDELQSMLNEAAVISKGNYVGTGWDKFCKTMDRLEDVYGIYSRNSSGEIITEVGPNGVENVVMSDGLSHAFMTVAIKELEYALIPFNS